MKIAQIVCVYPPYRGGIGKAAQVNTEYLKNRGHEVTVFTPASKCTENDFNNEVKYLKPVLRLGNAAVMLQLFNGLKGFDLVILHYPFFGSTEMVFLSRLFHKHNPKLIIHYHMDVLELGFFKRFFTFPSFIIREKLFNMADMVICSSLDYIKNGQIKNIYNQIPEKFKELPFTVDTDIFSPKTSKEKGFIDILFVGGMDKAHYFKGVDILIKAFSKIKLDNIRLNLVGNGKLINEYETLSADLGIKNKVFFYSNIDDNGLINKYNSADIFVLPSINSHEAFGIVLLEAMSSGIPVIASDLPGVRTVFENGKHGLICRPGDEEDLKNKIEELVSDPEKRIKMGESARLFALEKYSLQNNIDKLEDLINSI